MFLSRTMFYALAVFTLLLVCISPLVWATPSVADNATTTVFNNFHPQSAVAKYNPATGDLTVDVDTTPPSPLPGAPQPQAMVRARKTASPSDFVRLEFFRRTDDQENFSADANSLFSANAIFVGATTQGHFQSTIVRNKAHFVLHLSPSAISRETRLVMVISFTQNGAVKGPAFTTVILTPPTSDVKQ